MKKSLLEKLIDQFIPDIRNGFLSAVRDIVDNARLSAVENAIRTGDPVGALRVLGVDHAKACGWRSGCVRVTGASLKRLTTF